MIYELDGIAPVLGQGAWVAPDANLIGKVVLEDAASVWFGATLRGELKLDLTRGRGTTRCRLESAARPQTQPGRILPYASVWSIRVLHINGVRLTEIRRSSLTPTSAG